MIAGPRVLLLMDYDGTLREIAERPEMARPSAALLSLLRRLELHPGVIPAIVTGRSIDVIRNLLPLRRTWFVGTHGVEICRGFGRRRYLIPTGRARAAVQSICRQLAGVLDSQFTLENKGVSLALHFRLAAPGPARRARRRLRNLSAPHLRSGALEELHGKGVVELRPPGAHKGLAAAFLMKRAGADTLTVAIGDDRTDEDMFRAVRGRGISVGVGRRAAGADVHLAGPAAVLAMLRRLIKELPWKS